MNLEDARKLIDYDPIAGVARNTRTGKINQRTLMLDGKKEYLNRVLYEMYYGPIGKHVVVFKDGDKDNFKANNLELDTNTPAVVTRKASEYREVNGEQQKTCTQCNQWKSLCEFQYRKDTKLHRSECHACVKQRKIEYYSVPKRQRERRNNSFLLNYGITHDDYDRLLAKQGNACAICGTTDPSGKSGRFSYFSIDHCHDTGAVRGLLCNHCNRGIGFLQDSPVLLTNALKYLQGVN